MKGVGWLPITRTEAPTDTDNKSITCMNISLRWLGAVFGKALSRQALSVKALPLVLAGSVLAPHTFATVADGTCPAGSLGEIATLALIQKKPALDTDDFRTYWRDIHGMLATRIPGFWTYTQHHLEEEILSAADNPARSGEQLH